MRRYLATGLAVCSIGLYGGPALAQLPINSVHDGQIIQGGVYGNTVDQVTTFKNSSGSGLWLKSGSHLRGLEVDSAGKVTNNGGSFHFDAPGQVVRFDGNIDVRGVSGRGGQFYGNGGTVCVDAAYLYQNGNIYANGINGGYIHLNVGAAVFNPSRHGTSLQAMGVGGQGGVIAVKSTGPVDIQAGSHFDTSGTVVTGVNSNLIHIQGGLVNLEGTLIADGVQSRGGTIRLISTGNSDLSRPQTAIQQSGVLNPLQATQALQRLQDLKAQHDGDIYIAPNHLQPSSSYPIAYLTANGDNWNWRHKPTAMASGNDTTDPTPRAGDGGVITFSAQRDIVNSGWLSATGGYDAHLKGGNGGRIHMTAGSGLTNTGRVEANGMVSGTLGGDGGRIALHYKNSMDNSGVIKAAGGNNYNADGQSGKGGLISFQGPGELIGDGRVYAMGGLGRHNGAMGTVVAPNPKETSNKLYGIWRKLGSL